MDVLIVGAGPSGLTLANALAARDVKVRIVDRATEPARTSRANILHARGCEVLNRLGALGDLPQRSLEPMGIRMHARGKELVTMRFSSEASQALFISQAAIEEQLRQRLEELGVKVEWGTELIGLEPDEDTVTARFAHGTQTASWVVGCDGAHSRVRQAAGIDFPGTAIVEQFLLADVHATWDRDRGVSAGWFHRDGMLLAMPMPDERGNLWRLMADVPHSPERLDDAGIVQRLRELLPQRTGESEVDIHDAIWCSVFRVHRRLADDYRAGRVLLSGDAAHIHSPMGGQGMNTGIGDAENLAWKLAMVVEGRASHQLLDTYTAERRPLASQVLRNTTNNTRMMLGENSLTRFARDRVILPVLRSATVQRRATQLASQLWVTYRDGPLGGKGSRPRAGDRIADDSYRLSGGTSVRLHKVLGPEWAIAVAGMDNAAVNRIEDIAREYLGNCVTLYDDNRRVDAFVIRPDGHLAWRGDNPEGFARWCRRALWGEEGA